MMAAWFLLGVLCGADPASWPACLGQGAVPLAAEELPLKWDAVENRAWVSRIRGHGQSSPVIWGDGVYVTSITGDKKQTLIVSRLKLSDGTLDWEREAASTFPQKNSVYISRAAPTPVVDETGVFALFESGDLLAFRHDGELRWTISLSQQFGPPDNSFGLAASLLQQETSLFALVDHAGPSYLVAVDKTHGKTAWKTDRTSRTSWSSPAWVSVEGTPHIVCSSAGTVEGYDPATGYRLWTLEGVAGNTGVTPFSNVDGQFLVGASSGREGENAEGARRSNGLVRVSRQDKSFTAEFVWRTDEAQTSWPSPCLTRTEAYWINRAGIVFCFDAITGAKHYSQRIAEAPWATPLIAGDRLYFFGKSGKTTVLRAGKTFEILAENSLWERDLPLADEQPELDHSSEERRRGNSMFSGTTIYAAAAVPGRLLLRTGSHVIAIGNRD